MTRIESGKLDFRASLVEKAELVNSVLIELLERQTDIQPQLATAMNYTLKAPGKRIRAAIVLWCCELIAGRINDVTKTAAAAIEMVHTYSLIHDDLPAMDDDDLRRGRPSCHKAFGEATAILTGDALLTLAFEVLAKEVEDPVVAIKLIKSLAEAAGPSGMIAGQMTDEESQSSPGSVEMLQHIHTNKTAKMFAAAAVMGAIAGGADDKQLEHLARYGLKIGLGFQVADDILDVSGSSEHLGKTAGKDARQGKMTHPAVVGLAESKRIAKQLADEAVETLHIFDQRADTLRQLAVELLERTR